jgi:hypothetical protein
MVRSAITKGISDTIAVEDIVDPVPLDLRLAFAQQQVDPEHKPLRASKLKPIARNCDNYLVFLAPFFPVAVA